MKQAETAFDVAQHLHWWLAAAISFPNDAQGGGKHRQMNDMNVARKGIKRIEKDSVSRICSSQVIVNLETAVKELVENAIVRPWHTFILYSHIQFIRMLEQQLSK